MHMSSNISLSVVHRVIVEEVVRRERRASNHKLIIYESIIVKENLRTDESQRGASSGAATAMVDDLEILSQAPVLVALEY